MAQWNTGVGTLMTGLALLGCGPSNSSSTTGGTNATSAGSGGKSGAGDGGAAITGSAGSGANVESGAGGSARGGATSGGASGTGGAYDPGDYIGTLQVLRTVSPPASTRASVRFDLVGQVAPDPPAPAETCTDETYGACVVTKCPAGVEMDPAPPVLPSTDLLDAGTITMTVDMGTFSATGKPTLTDHAYAFDSTGSLGGAELLTISATGGTVSPFTAKVSVPFTPLLLMPSLVGSQGAVDVPVPRTADFTFGFDARGASQKLQIVASYPLNAPGSQWLGCTFDPSAGTGTFQAAALSQFPAGTRLRLFGVNSAAVETPEGAVAILVAFEMISADKMSFPAFVLQ